MNGSDAGEMEAEAQQESRGVWEARAKAGEIARSSNLSLRERVSQHGRIVFDVSIAGSRALGAELKEADLALLHDYVLGGPISRGQALSKEKRAARAAGLLQDRAYWLIGGIRVTLAKEAKE